MKRGVIYKNILTSTLQKFLTQNFQYENFIQKISGFTVFAVFIRAGVGRQKSFSFFDPVLTSAREKVSRMSEGEIDPGSVHARDRKRLGSCHY